jgi:CRP/FNR family transcriptional regulator, cyclic AMP receptor protein
MADVEETLSRVPLFSSVKPKDLKKLEKRMAERSFNEGDEITTEGESGIGFFVIEDGEARVTIQGDERRRLGPGDYFGEVALLTDRPRTATITAESDLRCYGMTSWDFKPLVETHGSIAWKLLQAMAKNYAD